MSMSPTQNKKYKMKYFNKCLFCGKEFNPNRRTQKFCSRWCAVRGRKGDLRRKVELNAQCAYCGKQIYVQPKRLKNSERVYCGFDCMGAHRRVLMNGEDNPNFRDLPPKICDGCGKEFRSYNKSRRYCSAVCSHGASKNEALANLKRGLEAEKMCAKEVTRHGYMAFLSAGSRGEFDVIGISSSEILLIQVKRTKSTQPGRIFPKKAVIKLRNAEYPHGGIAKKQIWCWVDPHKKWYIKDV